MHFLPLRGKAYIIDVSQSVEHDHPNALHFLRKDITNLNDFFKRKGVNVLTVKEFFDFVVDLTLAEGEEEAALDTLSERAASRTNEEMTAKEKVEEEVFKQVPNIIFTENSFTTHSVTKIIRLFFNIGGRKN